MHSQLLSRRQPAVRQAAPARQPRAAGASIAHAAKSEVSVDVVIVGGGVIGCVAPGAGFGGSRKLRVEGAYGARACALHSPSTPFPSTHRLLCAEAILKDRLTVALVERKRPCAGATGAGEQPLPRWAGPTGAPAAIGVVRRKRCLGAGRGPGAHVPPHRGL